MLTITLDGHDPGNTTLSPDPCKLFRLPYNLRTAPPSSPVRINYHLSKSPSMSHSQYTASSSSQNFQLIINNALDKYKKRTGNDLLAHPLAAQLQSCDSPSAILAALQQQIQWLDQSRSSDDRWSRWLDPTINVVYALSSTVGAGVGLVCLRGELVCDLRAHAHLAGILACHSNIFWDRTPPFSLYPS